MRVLVGEYPSQKVRRIATSNGWGEMYIYKPPRSENFHRSGFDNGAYLDWRNGREFDEKRFRDALDVAIDVGIPYLAVCPDLVARGLESLEFSMGWLSKLTALYPWYLAVQDGMEPRHIEPVICHFDGIFLGGTDEFKAEAADWCNLAHIAGKRFHFGRAGTERKIKFALAIGADSIDSAFPLWNFQRIARMEYLVSEWQTREPQLCFPNGD